MRRIKFSGLRVGVFLFFWGLYLPCAVSAELKIGYVNAQRILEESKAGRKLIKERERLAKEKREGLERIDAEIFKLQEELQKKQLVLSVEAKSELEEKIRRKQIERQRYREDSIRELKKFEKEGLKAINNAAMKIIRQIGKDEGYDFILEERESNLLFVNPIHDITDQVIKIYDEQVESEETDREKK